MENELELEDLDFEEYEDDFELDDEEEEEYDPSRGLRAIDRDERHHGQDGQRQGRHHGDSQGNHESEGHHRPGKQGRHEPKGKHQEGHKGPNGKHPKHDRCCKVFNLGMIMLIAGHFMIIKALKHYQEMHAINTGKNKVTDSSYLVQQQPQFVVSAPVQQVYEYSEPANTSQIREEKDKVEGSIFIPNTGIQSDKNTMV